jgi:hypothetical protein
MPLYSIHIRGSGFQSLADAAFVCQSFSWKAFFFGPFWLALHRLWLGLALWAIAYFLLVAAADSVISGGASVLIALALQILFGLEANRLSEAKLARRGYHLTGIVSAPALDAAESAFYGDQIGEISSGADEANAQAGGQ